MSSVPWGPHRLSSRARDASIAPLRFSHLHTPQNGNWYQHFCSAEDRNNNEKETWVPGREVAECLMGRWREIMCPREKHPSLCSIQLSLRIKESIGTRCSAQDSSGSQLASTLCLVLTLYLFSVFSALPVRLYLHLGYLGAIVRILFCFVCMHFVKRNLPASLQPFEYFHTHATL